MGFRYVFCPMTAIWLQIKNGSIVLWELTIRNSIKKFILEEVDEAFSCV